MDRVCQTDRIVLIDGAICSPHRRLIRCISGHRHRVRIIPCSLGRTSDRTADRNGIASARARPLPHRRRFTRLHTFISGVTFGLGLAVSGMSQQSKVISFLNLMGPWDPSLGFVMAGAVTVSVRILRLAQRILARMFILPWFSRPETELVSHEDADFAGACT